MSALLAMCLALSAAPDRAGIFIGSNGAPMGRTPLVHAEADARRMMGVFVDLGELSPENAVLLVAPTGDAILEAIRRIGPGAGMVVFYYSGHADDRALLLDGSELSFVELTRALDSVGAKLSLHLVDACRSGALTRRKGATLGERFTVDAADRGEGKVVITSSAEWEDSQESDRIGGSFFTLHMATGLRGAADTDADGRVTLGEAYRYVYGRTVESTIGSSAGVQHPTFSYDLSGRGDLVLTWPPHAGGTLVFGDGDYLVVESGTGHIAAEVGTRGARVNLPPGDYRVKKRARSEVLSGQVLISRGVTLNADDVLTEREAHARLVRKGGGSLSHVIRLSGGVRGPLSGGVGAAALFRVGYELALPWFSFMPYGATTAPSAFDTPRLTFQTHELGLGVLVSRAQDFEYVTLRGGLSAEGVRIAQSASTEPERATWGGAFAGQIAFESPPLLGDFVASLAAEAAVYVFRSSDADRAPAGDGVIVTHPTYRVLFSLGYEL